MASPQDAHVCGLCGRAFGRAENLRRHFLVHTSVCPHRCRNCQKLFKRKDSLNRHLTTCIPGSAQSSSSLDPDVHRCFNQNQRCRHEKPFRKLRQDASEHGVDKTPVINIPTKHRMSSSPYERGRYVISSGLDVPISQPQIVILPDPPDTLQATTKNVPQMFDSSVDGESSSAANYDTQSSDQIPTMLPSTMEYQWTQTTNQCTIPSFLQPVLPTFRSLSTPLPSPTDSFPFLIHFTKRYNLQVCFQSRNSSISSHTSLPEAREQLSSDPTSALVGDTSFSHDELLPSESVLHRNAPALAWRNANWFCFLESGVEALAPPKVDFPTVEKDCKIRSALRTIVPNWSTLHELRGVEMFSVERILFFLDLYWSSWHPNWPVIHKPTFDIVHCPAPLLGAMVIVGACHSPNNKDHQDARYWFEPVERLAYLNLQDDLSKCKSHRKVQNIQAAFLVCIYQTWDGDDHARARFRRGVFNTLVNASRDLDLSSAKHVLPNDFASFDWTAFVQMEERIRTLLWVFCLDTAYVIFNSMPPRFALRELRLGLASPEACFQAETAQGCFSALQAWLSLDSRSAYSSLYSLIKMFFNPDLNDRMLNNLAHESFLNLWCVVAAFHTVIFNIDPMLGGKEQLSWVQTGIENWKAVWFRRLRNDDEQYFDIAVVTEALSRNEYANLDSWKRPGFWKHAAEYWLLAQVMLERMVSAQQSADAANELCGPNGLHFEVASHVNEEIEDGTMEKLHYFLVSLA